MHRMLSMKMSELTLAKLVIQPMPGGVLEHGAHGAAADVEVHGDAGVLGHGPRSGSQWVWASGGMP